MTQPPMAWSAILRDAVTRPGVIADAYRRFWNYSTGNQLLALFQCLARRIEPGPIHTFVGWHALGRHVRKGERALTLCMPVTCKSRKPAPSSRDPSSDEPDQAADPATVTMFVFRPHWFVLAQTEGVPYQPVALPGWDESRALGALSIERIAFDHLDGNTQGYARGRQVAVSPIAFAPQRTLFHELAHVVLGHTAESSTWVDVQEPMPRDLREVEAECVALLCTESLGLSGVEFSRGYIQHWLGSQTIPDRSARRVFSAADAILRAGHPEPSPPRPAA